MDSFDFALFVTCVCGPVLVLLFVGVMYFVIKWANSGSSQSDVEYDPVAARISQNEHDEMVIQAENREHDERKKKMRESQDE